jgi:hypothetical protein
MPFNLELTSDEGPNKESPTSPFLAALQKAAAQGMVILCPVSNALAELSLTQVQAVIRIAAARWERER